MISRTFITGDKIPALGLGTWKLRDQECLQAVKTALELGYQHIDTATIYHNEDFVGEGIKQSGAKRKDIFLTSKLWPEDYHKVAEACEESLRKLQTDYLDLYLMHWPSETVPLKEIIEAMNELVKQGKVKNMGVSNFSARLFQEAQSFSDVPLVCLQVECHPLLQQKKLIDFCQKNKVILTAYSPLARGRCFEHPVITEMAEKYQKSPAQICLRWVLEQDNVVAIPKATSLEHLKDNLTVLDWQMDKDDWEKISAIEEEVRMVDFDFCKWEEWE